MVFPAKIVDIHDEWDFLTVKVGLLPGALLLIIGTALKTINKKA